MSAALGGVVFDTAGLTAWANRAAYAHAVGWATADAGNTIVVPATVLAAARAVIPVDRLDILGVLLNLPHTVVISLERVAAEHLGTTLAGRSDVHPSIAAGHATYEAVARGWPCLTDRAEQLRQIDSRVIADPLP